MDRTFGGLQLGHDGGGDGVHFAIKPTDMCGFVFVPDITLGSLF